MAGFAERENSNPGMDAPLEPGRGEPVASSGPNGSRVLAEHELEAALQLLVERAQYITGATGTALALPQGNEMVCRASAGSCAPAIGARLQVRSGLTGESIARHQLLRCDNAETDPRVNLEACRALGIASIVVLPLLRRNGEVRGLFELFSDHPYAFEERDLIALERMADLTLTALDLAEQRHGEVPPAPHPKRISAMQGVAPETVAAMFPTRDVEAPTTRADEVRVAPTETAPPTGTAETTEITSPMPEAMRRVQKCASCGFPVSEGRTYCLDCEKKKDNASGLKPIAVTTANVDVAEAVPAAEGEELPPFLANAAPFKESWLANHVNLLAILVVIVGVLVAFVVFR